MSHEHTDDNHVKLDTGRLAGFSDGVMAIIITITVLEFKIPTGGTLSSLVPLIPLFIAYAVSFQTVGTYWNNHHHLIRATDHVSPSIMWSNLHLLFWLSFIPFSTGWIGENHGGALPTAVYAAILFMCAIAYTILQQSVLHHSHNRHKLLEEVKRSPKGVFSLFCYLAAIPLAFLSPVISDTLIIIVAAVWFIPDRRIVKNL